MHAGRRGKSGSTKPVRSTASTWIKHKKDVVEKLVTKYGKDDLSASKIGLVLRDQYGIPNIKDITGKRVSEILKENEITKPLPQDLLDLMKRAVTLREHIKSNKKDLHSTRGLTLIESKIRRLTKYYKRTERINADWNYNPEEAKLIVG